METERIIQRLHFEGIASHLWSMDVLMSRITNAYFEVCNLFGGSWLSIEFKADTGNPLTVLPDKGEKMPSVKIKFLNSMYATPISV